MSYSEVWRELPTQSLTRRYFISSFGRVKCQHNGLDRILVTNINSEGYERITLNVFDKKRAYGIHVLVARGFIPNPENKRFVNHKDYVRTNNHLSNLEWATKKEDVAHSLKRGRKGKVSKKLSFIQTMLIEGFSDKDIATKTNLSTVTIYKIRKRTA